jgi:hypothetical protein
MATKTLSEYSCDLRSSYWCNTTGCHTLRLSTNGHSPTGCPYISMCQHMFLLITTQVDLRQIKISLRMKTLAQLSLYKWIDRKRERETEKQAVKTKTWPTNKNCWPSYDVTDVSQVVSTSAFRYYRYCPKVYCSIFVSFIDPTMGNGASITCTPAVGPHCSDRNKLAYHVHHRQWTGPTILTGIRGSHSGAKENSTLLRYDERGYS